MQYFNSEGFTYQLAISKSLDSAFTKTTNQQQLVFALSQFQSAFTKTTNKQRVNTQVKSGSTSNVLQICNVHHRAKLQSLHFSLLEIARTQEYLGCPAHVGMHPRAGTRGLSCRMPTSPHGEQQRLLPAGDVVV